MEKYFMKIHGAVSKAIKLLIGLFVTIECIFHIEF